MQQLLQGKYFSTYKHQRKFNELLLTDSEYKAQRPVPWHYHENAYFSYILSGHLLEVNKKETIICSPGTLIFNNTHDSHYNKNHTPYTRHLYIELRDEWFKSHHIDQRSFHHGLILDNSFLASLIKKIYLEFRINDDASELSIEGFLLLGFGSLIREQQTERSSGPAWVSRIKEIINDKFDEKITLHFLSAQTGIHPIYISQNFHKYFHSSLSAYVRKVKVERATLLLRSKCLSLAQIAYECGFSDQSHFIRCFKEINQMTPSQYRLTCFGS